MHHLAVALDEELIRDLDAADGGDAADIVAAEIEQHQVLGAFLGVGQQLVFERLVLVRRGAARPGPGDRPDCHRVAAGANQNFRARPGNGEIGIIEIEQERRRIDPPQRPVERERRQRERRLETLRQHHLKNIAGRDVVLRARDHGEKFRRAGVRARRHRGGARRIDCGFARDRPVEPVEHRAQPVDGAAKAALAVTPARRAHRRHQRDGVEHGVEDDHHGRTHQDGVGDSDRVRLRRRADSSIRRTMS